MSSSTQPHWTQHLRGYCWGFVGLVREEKEVGAESGSGEGETRKEQRKGG